MVSPAEIQKLLDRLETAYKKLGEANPFKNFNASAFDNINDAVSVLNDGLLTANERLSYLDDDLSKISAGFKKIVDSIKTQNQSLNLTSRAFNNLSNLAQKLKNDQTGINELTKKDLENLVKRANQERANLVTAKNMLETTQKERALDLKEIDSLKEINALLDGQGGFFESLIENAKDRIKKEDEINKKLGATPGLLGGIGKAMKNLGLPDFGLDKVLEDTKSILREEKDRVTVGKALNTYSSQFSNNLKSQLTTSNILQFVILQLVAALTKADTQTGQLAKAFGTSYSEATSLRNELNTVANLSGDINITTGALQESLIAVNKEFGTATMFSGELLKDFTNMTKVMGYTDEAAAKLSKITVATGTDLSDNTAQILGTAAAFNVTNKVALNEKEIVEGVAKASAATTVSLGMQPGKIAAAVVQAKALGLELEQVEGIAESLLNFESSISNELEAELLTGRALNLEQARYLALTNDVGGVAKEIANQGITAAEFGKMNVIQQKSLAEAVGLTKEELAQSLINQQALTKLGGKDKTIAEAYNRLKKEGLSDDQIAKKLGDEKLTQQLKSQSIQERFNASVEKLQELFVSIAEPILQIVSPFMDLATTILPLVNIALSPITAAFKFIGESLNFTLGLIKQIASPLLEVFSPLFKGFSEFVEENKDFLYFLNGVKSIVGSIVIAYGAIAAYNKTAALFAGIKLIAERNTEKSLIAQGFILAKNLIKDIASAVAKVTGASATTLGYAALTAAVAGAATYSFLNSKKGNDIMSPGNKTSGYGERTLFGPEGAIQLNNKDTVIAGTNLFDGTAQTTSPSVSINITPLVNEMQAVKAVLVQILNKDSNVYLDGAKVGKGIAMASSKIG